MDSTDLREERKRTGRYVATVAALFGLVLGIYHFLTQGTPQYAALFLPAVIMFVYVFWILNVSKRSRKMYKEAILAEHAATTTSVTTLNEVKVIPECSHPRQTNLEEEISDDGADISDNAIEKSGPPLDKPHHTFCRTYSIA